MTKGAIVKLADLVTVEHPRIENQHFEDVTIVGPAIVSPDEVHFTQCRFSYGENGPETLFWEVDDSKTIATGHIEVVNCTFTRCRFVGVGFAGNHDLLHKLASIARVA